MRTINNSKVAIVYPNLPHYRFGVFKELDARIQNLMFISSLVSKDGSIAGIPHGALKNHQVVKNLWIGPFLWQRGLGTTLKKYSPDTVVFLGNIAHISTWWYAIICRLVGKRVVFWTIGWHRPESGLKKWSRMLFYGLANNLWLYGNFGFAIGKELGFPTKKMKVIYNSGVSLSDHEDVDLSDSDLPTGSRPVIGAVIRLSPGKGLDDVLEAAVQLKESHAIDVDVLIVGEGAERVRLESLAKQLDVSLYLPGAVYSSSQLAKVYELMDVSIIPKAAGLTVIQSLSYGTPVVTAKDPYIQMPEFEAVIDGKTGSLMDDISPASIASASEKWLQSSPDRRAQVADDCREEVSVRWSPESQCDLIIEDLAK